MTLDGADRRTYTFGDMEVNISKRKGTERHGIFIFVVYKGDVSSYKELDWIQINKTDAPIDGKLYNEWIADFSKDDRNKHKYINEPFYYDNSSSIKSWRGEMNKKYGGIVFQDGPNRAAGNYTWIGQLSLVGYRNFQWETIQTFQYGFSVDGGWQVQIYPIPFQNNINNFSNSVYGNMYFNSILNRLNSFFYIK